MTLIRVSVASLVSLCLSAQSFTGSIVGVVADSSGAIVSAVTLTAINQATGERRSVESTNAGQFSIIALSPATYTLEAELRGFRKFKRENIRVGVLQNVRADVVLEPGEITETVNVTAESPLLETTDASVGQVVDNKKIIDLPLIGRNAIALVQLTTGVQAAVTTRFGGQPVLVEPYDHGAFSVNSGLQMSSEFLLDGVPNNAFLWNAPALVPSADAVQEFKVQTSSLSAEFGHTGGGIVNLTIKSGTNVPHGHLFHFLRNEKLDANNFFNNRTAQPRPPFKTNQFGGGLGGPVMLPGYNGRNKTFFFANYDGFRDRRNSSTLTTVPLAALRRGDFSEVRNADGQGVTVYDPLTVRAEAGVGSGFIRSPFPGNRISRDRVDPISAKVADYWELPNLPGTGPAFANNFIANVSVADIQDQVNVKIDHLFSEKHRTFGRFTFDRQLPGSINYFRTARGASGGGSLNVWNRNVGLDHTWTINPTLLASFRYGFMRQRVVLDPNSLGIDLKEFGFPADFANVVQEKILPSFLVPGFANIGEAGFNTFIHRGDNMHAAQASLTKSLSRQSLKFGFEIRSFLFNDIRAPDCCGRFEFTAGFTQQDPLRAAATAGHAFASFLLGHPSNGRMQFFPAVSLNQNYYALYLQDDIRVTSNLTLNFGIRWDVETPKNERYDRLSYFDADVRSPLSDQVRTDVRGGLGFVGVNGSRRGQWASDLNNFAPRAGFAYRFTPRFVMRGGYGIFFHQTVGQGGAVGHGNDGYSALNTMITTLDGGITVANRVSNPFPEGLSGPTGSAPGLIARLGEGLRPWTGYFPNPYSQRFNFGLQREFRGEFLVDIAYVGSRSLGLPIIVPQNQLDPRFLPLQNQLLAQVPNPFVGIINVGALRLPMVQQRQLLRPHPQFDDITLYAPIAQQSYHSLQLKVERRFRNDIGILMAYTAAKSLTNAGNTGIFGFQSPRIQNYYDMRGEKALSPIDVNQRLVLSYQWEFPFGRGKRLLGGATGVVNHLVSGWQVNGITTLQTGLPLQLTTAVNQTNVFGANSRPNIASGATALLSESERSITRWFNTTVFSQPPAFTFGNASRTQPDARVPGMVHFDLSLFKNTRLTERVVLQLRGEAFNALNHTNFGAPGQVFGTPQFGVLGGANPARQLQLAAKVLF